MQWVITCRFNFKFLFIQRYRNRNCANSLGKLFDMLVDTTSVFFQKMPTVPLHHCFLLCFDLSDEPMVSVTCTYRRKRIMLQGTQTTWLSLPLVTIHNAWCPTQAYPKALLFPCSHASSRLCNRLWRHLSWTLPCTQKQGSSVEISQLCSFVPCSEMHEAIRRSNSFFWMAGTCTRRNKKPKALVMILTIFVL